MNTSIAPEIIWLKNGTKENNELREISQKITYVIHRDITDNETEKYEYL